jgi:peptidoglycan/LPS O-acetylase OafA/YrhL
VIRRRLEFRWAPGWRSAAGVALIVFALVVYPVWSAYAGHRYPATATFGLPCPTTIFTLGVLAFAARPYPRSPLIVPLLWCFVGAQAAFLLSVPPDLGLIAAAVVGIGLLVTARQQSRASTS